MVGVEILRWLGLSQSIIRQLWLDFALFVKKSETQNKKQNKKQKNKHLFRKRTTNNQIHFRIYLGG
jgi:hypothetical protein